MRSPLKSKNIRSSEVIDKGERKARNNINASETKRRTGEAEYIQI
jgi:hypothetical protein